MTAHPALDAAKRCLLGLFTLIVLASCSQHHSELQERLSYWKTELASNVPKGTSKDAVLQWGHSRQIRFEYLENQHWLYAKVEHGTGAGLDIPCHEWNIVQVVILDQQGRAARNEVNAVGACL